MVGEITNKLLLRFLLSKLILQLDDNSPVAPAEVYYYFFFIKDHTCAASVESISSSCSQSSENEGRVLAVSPQHFSIIS